MPVYQAPIADHHFILHDYLRVHERSDIVELSDLTSEFSGDLLRAASRFYEDVLHPINQRGDIEGATLVDGKVQTPSGFPAAWNMYKEAGWHRMTLQESIGGEGLPPVMSVPMEEMGMASGHSLMMYGGFCASAAKMLSALGDDWMREHVVPRLVAGDWTATMCLTEPHCGTDLRQLRTRAQQQPDGSWRLTGTKIFISGGDHDLTDNIAHIVLAKVPQTDGTLGQGLSSVNVFLVSKRQIDTATGQLGEVNGVSVSSLEHKMGIAASATCVLNFENSAAWRISGHEQGGTSANMAGMFLMMNHARVATAISGVSYAEIAYQNAAAYARERLSGRAAAGARHPNLPADPIVVHPDIRRLLLESRSFAEGGRAAAMRLAFLQSIAAGSKDVAERERAGDLVELLTPVIKAYFTDKGFEAANACLQVLGGHGYVRDLGLEQFVRNARIGMIYEGANGIQAMDLVGRKLPAHGGRGARHFFGLVKQTVDSLRKVDGMHSFSEALAVGAEQLQKAVVAMMRHAEKNPDAPGAAAYDLLTMFGILTIGWSWCEIALIAQQDKSVSSLSPQRVQQKLTLARVWMEREMPLIGALAERVYRGPDALMALSDDAV
jgi:alkylation response protein AidB-like acyl-CoA dehydrogenase